MTIKDIAKELNLSTSTVSKALNNATDVSLATKQRVLAYAQQTGFSLRNNSTQKRICVLFENMDSRSNSQVGYPVLTGFQQAANAYHYEVIVEHCTDVNAPDLKELCRENDFCALMILGTKLSSSIMKELEHTDVPVMLMDSYIKNPKVSCISSDNINPVAAIVERLIALGHKKIGYLGGDMQSIVTRERFAGYLIGLTEGNLPYNSDYVQYVSYNEEGGRKAAAYYAKTDVTAVVCASDMIAIGLINGLKEYGLSVPGDISVSGFDDLDVAQYFTPSLTTVRQDFISLGSHAFTLLRQAIKGNKTKRVTIYTEPVFRNSIGPVKK